jgi:pimeloyl-ACP methyl ester carboxylesterase
MVYAQVDDLTMYYEEHGQPGGPPLALLHGFAHTGRISWNDQLDALGAGYHLLVPVRPHRLRRPSGARATVPDNRAGAGAER